MSDDSAPVIPVGSEAVIAGLWAALGQLDSAYSAYVAAALRGVGADSARSTLIATRASVNAEFEDAIAAAQGTGHERVIPEPPDRNAGQAAWLDYHFPAGEWVIPDSRCAYCGQIEGHSPRCSVTKFNAPAHRMPAEHDYYIFDEGDGDTTYHCRRCGAELIETDEPSGGSPS